MSVSNLVSPSKYPGRHTCPCQAGYYISQSQAFILYYVMFLYNICATGTESCTLCCYIQSCVWRLRWWTRTETVVSLHESWWLWWRASASSLTMSLSSRWLHALMLMVSDHDVIASCLVLFIVVSLAQPVLSHCWFGDRVGRLLELYTCGTWQYLQCDTSGSWQPVISIESRRFWI